MKLSENSILTVEEMVEKSLTHEIHTSERKSFRGCRRRWDWIFRGNYYPVVTAKPLEFGIAYHLAQGYGSPTQSEDVEVHAGCVGGSSRESLRRHL